MYAVVTSMRHVLVYMIGNDVLHLGGADACHESLRYHNPAPLYLLFCVRGKERPQGSPGNMGFPEDISSNRSLGRPQLCLQGHVPTHHSAGMMKMPGRFPVT
mmetsp:Transcript_24828/g.54078  ORF Transcript_24828/g.54078 Transcript_24828/m.54078 type:complete len:102 (-) Transcript_24828:198-503(-)